MIPTLERATNVLPGNARLVYSFTLVNNRRAFWIMQFASIIPFGVFGTFFLWFAFILHPDLFFNLRLADLRVPSVLLAWFLSLAVAILLHELVHGLFFWIFVRVRPVFGIRRGYAFAGAPGWYLPRRQYAVIGLAPLVVLSAIGMLLLALLPTIASLSIVFWGMLANAAGAVGDIWMVWLVLNSPGKVLVEDTGDGLNIYSLEPPG